MGIAYPSSRRPRRPMLDEADKAGARARLNPSSMLSATHFHTCSTSSSHGCAMLPERVPHPEKDHHGAVENGRRIYQPQTRPIMLISMPRP